MSEEHNDLSHGSDWSDELKGILVKLVDLAAKMLQTNASNLTLNEIVTADELAQRFKVSGSTVEELARRGKIPGAFRVGKHWRFDMDALRVGLQNRGPQDVDK